MYSEIIIALFRHNMLQPCVLIDWWKALICVWSMNNITHCDIITSLSNQFPIFLSLKKFGLSTQYC